MRLKTDSTGVYGYCLLDQRIDHLDKSGRTSLATLNKLTQFFTEEAIIQTIQQVENSALKTTAFVRYLELNPQPGYWKRRVGPLRMKTWIAYVGRTSYIRDIHYCDPITGEFLATEVLHAVKIDFKTRRPVKILESEFDRRGITRDAPPINFVLSPKPASVPLYETMVLSSDTDANQHMNTSAYIKLFMDAGSCAATDGKLLSFKTDLAFNDVGKLSVTFLGEAVVNDRLCIACWEDPGDAKLLNFEMLNRSQVISQCQVKFADHSNKLFSGDFRSLSKL